MKIGAMKRKTSHALLLAASLVVPALHAQTACPSGVAPGSARCGPSSDGSEVAPPRPTGYWVKTWGALVSSNTAAGAWTSKGKASEAQAVQDALGRCKAQGVSDCNVDGTYFNQCVAVVGSPNQRGLSIAKSPTIKEAGAAALKDCSERGKTQCAVVFSDCTDPYFVKY